MLISAMAAIAVLGAATPILAQDPAAAAQARHDHFKEIGKSMKGISDQLKSVQPSLPQIQVYAKRVDELAPQIPGWFPPGTGPESGIKTHAKAAVWKNPGEFKKDAAAFAVEAHNLALAAASGDLKAVGVAAETVGKTCGACHKVFREKED